jgi:peptide-methionine (R)-S-oxide reductase
MKKIIFILALLISTNTYAQTAVIKNKKDKAATKMEKVIKSNEQWKKELTEEQYHILREQGTERPYDGKYWDNHEKGMYECAGCGNDLFSSDTKFDSGTGWPSFWAPIAKDKVEINLDKTHGMMREEVVCAKCGGHLGHVFNDGPKPTGQRYCMNSGAMKFVK